MSDSKQIEQSILEHLEFLYGQDHASEIFTRLMSLIKKQEPKSDSLSISERDVIVIAYGDHVSRQGESPLVTLGKILNELELPISAIHILPFYPYSSDDGFSVIDYYTVDPALGDWQDIQALKESFQLMFDAVINHISSQSEWFQAYLRGESPYNDYFISADPDLDLSLVTRPRTLPLLSPFETTEGIRHLWTTFSDDQIDLNYNNPDVLLEIIKLLLFYVHHGADFIRLDAIAFLWKEIGTSCIHLPQTHHVIQLMRDVLDLHAPDSILITETNVPHAENIAYFGNGSNEAQMVYQFPLPPLILHTLSTGNSTKLSHWAKGIHRVSERTSFFNFTASHDGIGLRPVSEILSEAEIQTLVQLSEKHGGHVSYRNQSDGSKSPYELNISYFDAITDPAITTTNPDMAIARFMVSQAIMLALLGVPGIYFHSLFASRNDHRGVATTGRFRSINREKLDADSLFSELAESDSISAKVFSAYKKLLQIRSSEPAFHPLGFQKIINIDKRVFAVERQSPDKHHTILALHNVSGERLTLPLNSNSYQDLFTGAIIAGEIHLEAYQISWLNQK